MPGEILPRSPTRPGPGVPRVDTGPQRPGGCCPPSRPGPRWKPPGRAQHGQDTRRAAAGALDHRQTIPPPRSPALFALLTGGHRPAHTSGKFSRAGNRPGKPRSHFITAPARSAGRAQEPRTRYPDALPEPRITGHAAADPRQGTRCRYPLPLRSEGPGGPAAARRVLPILSRPGPRWKPP